MKKKIHIARDVNKSVPGQNYIGLKIGTILQMTVLDLTWTCLLAQTWF